MRTLSLIFKNIEEQLTLCSLEASENITFCMIAILHNPSLVPIDLDEVEDIDLEKYSDKEEGNI